jgi:hypothetical protein
VKRCQNLANFHEHGMISFLSRWEGSNSNLVQISYILGFR